MCNIFTPFHLLDIGVLHSQTMYVRNMLRVCDTMRMSDVICIYAACAYINWHDNTGIKYSRDICVVCDDQMHNMCQHDLCYLSTILKYRCKQDLFV